jgi:hypothetical protein
MAIYSPLRSRRLAAQQKEATQRLITFKLGGENFALRLDRVQKVTTLDRVYQDPLRLGMKFTTYQDREVEVVEIEQQIFGKPLQVIPSRDLKHSSQVDPIEYLLILQSTTVATATPPAANIAQEQRLLGFTIDLPPTIQSLPLSAFLPLSDRYSHLRCVSAVSHTAPVNALLRRRAFPLDGASLVAQQLNPDRTPTNLETDTPRTDRPVLFLLDTTAIVSGE